MGARRQTVVRAVESLARSDRRVASHPDLWDVDQTLFNTAGGVFELASGALRENRPTDYCSKIGGCGRAPEGTPCPLWLEFLRVIFQGDPELADLEILKSLAEEPALSVRERAFKFGMPESSLRLKLSGLVKRKFVEQAADKRYRLTAKGRKEIIAAAT
jgi:hypothetical protein